MINRIFSPFIETYSKKIRLLCNSVVLFLLAGASSLIFNIFPTLVFDFPSVVWINNSSDNSGSNNSSDENLEKQLDSIISDRKNLIRAKNSERTPEQQEALGKLQDKYPNELEGAENKDEFLNNIDKELTSKIEKLKNENDAWENTDMEQPSAEEIRDELEELDKAKNGDMIALKNLKDKFPDFFDEETGIRTLEKSLDQLKEMLEDDFSKESTSEEKNSDQLDDEIKENIRKDNPNLNESQVEEAFDALRKENNKNNKRKRDDDDDDDSNDNSKRGGTGGPSVGGSSGGPSVEGPSTGNSSYSKTSSTIDYVLEKNSCEWPSVYDHAGED